MNLNKECEPHMDTQEKIIQLYKSGLSLAEVGRQCFLTPYKIKKYLQKNNIPIRSRAQQNQLTNMQRAKAVNHEYFQQIDSVNKAWLLGFIAADGAISNNRNAITIKLSAIDVSILQQIKQELQIERNIFTSITNNGFEICSLEWSSQKQKQDLAKYGIVNNKTYLPMHLPKFTNDNLILAFILGYFDGDGSITIRDGKYPNDRGILCYDYSLYVQIRGTKDFLSGICNHLKIDTTHIHQNDSIPHLSFASKKDTYRFFQCYKNLPFYYKRKYDKFLQRINHPSYDKYKQVQTISSPIENL